jgi:uncharacterized membrane protein YfcA
MSVTRRILAILFGVCGAGVMSYLALYGVDEAFTALVATVGSVIGFYFGTKSQAT